MKAGMFSGRKSCRATDSAKRARRGKPLTRPSECPTSHRASSRPYQVSANALDPDSNSGRRAGRLGRQILAGIVSSQNPGIAEDP